MAKENEIVKVVRFIRPHKIDPWTMEMDNLYGITVIFQMNYAERSVSAQWSVCSGDNFNKKLGVQIAKYSTPVFIDLALVNEYGSLLNALTASLIMEEEKRPCVDVEEDIEYMDYYDYEVLYKNSLRRLNLR